MTIPQDPWGPGSAPTPYPPPPPNSPKPWTWVAIGVSALAALAFLALGAVFVYTFVLGVPFGSYEEGDDFYGEGYWVEQRSVERAVRVPCRDLVDAAAAFTPFAGPDQGSEQVGEVATALRDIATAVDGANPDGGSRAWRDDVVLLADALQDYADRLGDGSTEPFTLPEDGGEDVVERMSSGGPMGCEVPLGVRTLDPVEGSLAGWYDDYGY